MSELSLEAVLHPERTALVVWDMQVGIASNAHNLNTLVPTTNAVIDAAHKAGVKVFWSRHIGTPVTLMAQATQRLFMRRQNVTTPSDIKPFMVEGSAEVGWLAPISPGKSDVVIDKTTPSFFVGTPFEIRLRALRIESLVFAGVATEQGIELSARHALALGFTSVVISDAVGSFTEAAHDRGLTSLRAIVEVLNAAEVMDIWSRAA